ncbi:NUDIX hydrolase [Thermodesulfobacteriota bacterium]
MRSIDRWMVPLFRVWRLIARFPRVEISLLKILNTRFLVGAAAVVLDEERRILVLKHTYTYPNLWGLPGGWLEGGEEIETMIERELMEETGFKVRVERCLNAVAMPERHQVEVHYLCQYLSGEFRACAEISDYRFVSKEDLPEELSDRHRAMIERLSEEGIL